MAMIFLDGGCNWNNVAKSALTAFSKKWPNSEQLVKEFNAELAKFIATGQRKKIYDKYRIVSGLGQ